MAVAVGGTGVLVRVAVGGTGVGVLVLVAPATGVFVAVGGTGVLVRVAVGGTGVLVGVADVPQPGNLNAPTRVCQLAVPVVRIYSVVIQKVQSSVGSTDIIA